MTKGNFPMTEEKPLLPATKIICPVCHRQVALTRTGAMDAHGHERSGLGGWSMFSMGENIGTIPQEHCVGSGKTPAEIEKVIAELEKKGKAVHPSHRE